LKGILLPGTFPTIIPQVIPQKRTAGKSAGNEDLPESYSGY